MQFFFFYSKSDTFLEYDKMAPKSQNEMGDKKNGGRLSLRPGRSL